MASNCPECGNALFKTKRMHLSWLDVLVALAISSVVLIAFAEMTQIVHFEGRGGSRVFTYILLAVIGSIGWIFSKKVKKERFEVESCVRCTYKKTTRVSE